MYWEGPYSQKPPYDWKMENTLPSISGIRSTRIGRFYRPQSILFQSIIVLSTLPLCAMAVPSILRWEVSLINNLVLPLPPPKGKRHSLQSQMQKLLCLCLILVGGNNVSTIL